MSSILCTLVFSLPIFSRTAMDTSTKTEMAQQSLPVELWLLILDHITSSVDLKAMRLVNHQFSEIATPALFGEIILKRSGSSLQRLELLATSELLQHVKSLRLAPNARANLHADDLQIQEITSSVFDNADSEQLAATILERVQIETLVLTDVPYEIDGVDKESAMSIAHSHISINERLKVLRNSQSKIKYLEMRLRCSAFQIIQNDPVDLGFIWSSLVRFDLYFMGSYYEYNDNLDQPQAFWKDFSERAQNLECIRLVATDTRFSPNDVALRLSAFLGYASFSKLRELHLVHVVDKHDLEALGYFLTNHSETLTSLHVLPGGSPTRCALAMVDCLRLNLERPLEDFTTHVINPLRALRESSDGPESQLPPPRSIDGDPSIDLTIGYELTEYPAISLPMDRALRYMFCGKKTNDQGLKDCFTSDSQWNLLSWDLIYDEQGKSIDFSYHMY